MAGAGKKPKGEDDKPRGFPRCVQRRARGHRLTHARPHVEGQNRGASKPKRQADDEPEPERPLTTTAEVVRVVFSRHGSQKRLKKEKGKKGSLVHY